MSLSFTSCDEDADIGDTLYGTWKGYMDIGLTYGDHYYASTTSEITFIPSSSYSDHGTGYWIDRYSNAPWDYVANHIKWAVSNGVIKINFIEDDSFATIYNYSLDDDYFYGTVEYDHLTAGIMTGMIVMIGMIRGDMVGLSLIRELSMIPVLLPQILIH